ncbi:MAG TPA: class IV adenylate cyclase [Methanofastidiosum sp.]|nr:class IV adenylate cyclase [Methanofastidiosum sp.]HOC77548.1 class IV adenylate cyclase [Methanofastidiosum sp.]HPA49026.1 class IV adenylate cyclase [Methanofastidiosum sp.]HQK62373.1 class IV adenylate cyclase [Methanofastidiosum sp.]HQM94811.1 class IV adenylate cyclase [Methanofastidiosum sp.]
MLELEMKAKIDKYNRGRVEQITKKAEYLGERLEEDIYFSSPIKNFKETDEALRIRKSQGKTILTYKGPKIDRISKSREEIETFVSGDINLILERLGFYKFIEIKKKRKLYRYNEFMISIDDVEGLGEYIEVELKSEKKEDVKKIEHLFDILYLDSERRSYLELILIEKK